MSIQVKQEFPHCERCGVMVHTKRRRIVATAEEGPVILCSELCRDELSALRTLSDPGHWVESDPSGAGGRR